MKKLLSLLLALSLVFVFTACGGKGTISDTSVSNEEFVKPENYSTVVLVTINPQFRLYLDAAGEVLAVEPVNDDAKSITKEVKTIKGNLETVIDGIVSASSEGGFVKKDVAATVNFEITEIKNDTVDTKVILEKAKESADDSFEKLHISVEVKTSVADNAKKNNISSAPVSSSAPTQTSSVTSSQKEEGKPVHNHSFSAANCTTPKKCSCGATEGKALGHNYKDGKCTRCGAKDANHVSYTSVSKKGGIWSVKYVYNGTYYDAGLNLREMTFGVGVGDPLSAMEQEKQDDIRKHKDEPGYKESYIVFEGKEYWSARGGGPDIKPITESGNIVTVTALEESTAQIIFTRTDENTLTVKSVSTDFKAMVEDIPVGTKFTFKAN